MAKRYGYILFVAVVAMFAIRYSVALQEQGSEAQQPQGHHHWGGPPDAAARLEHMTKELRLTSDQQAKIKPMLEDQQKQADALRQDNSLSQDDRRAKFMELRKNTDSQIRAELNADQQKKFDKMQQRHEGMEHHHEHSHDSAPPQGGEAPPPQQP